MRTTIPQKTVEVCDFCNREGYLRECHVCGRSFCLVDEGLVGQCWGFTKLCCECSQRDDVGKICERYAKRLAPLYRQRERALKRLRRTKDAGTEPAAATERTTKHG